MVCYLADVLFQNIMVIYLPCKIIETLNLENVYKASSSVVCTMRVSSIVLSILPKIWQLISSKARTLIYVLAVVNLRLLLLCYTVLYWGEWCPSKIRVPPKSSEADLI